MRSLLAQLHIWLLIPFFTVVLHPVTPPPTRPAFYTYIIRPVPLSSHLARETRLYFFHKLLTSESAPLKSFRPPHRSLGVTENVHGLTRRHATCAVIGLT